MAESRTYSPRGWAGLGSVELLLLYSNSENNNNSDDLNRISSRDHDGQNHEHEQEGISELVDLKISHHKITVLNRKLVVLPSIESARSRFIKDVNNYCSVATSLPRLNGSRFAVFSRANEITGGAVDYSRLLNAGCGKIDKAILSLPLRVIEVKVQETMRHCAKWMAYQPLWDASTSSFDNGGLGSDLGKWSELLENMIASRTTTIEADGDIANFGPIVVEHQYVQTKINQKFDSWQQNVQNRLGSVLADRIASTQQDVFEMTNKLQEANMSDISGSSRVIATSMETVFTAKETLPVYRAECEELEKCEMILVKQHYRLPGNWQEASSVSKALAASEDLLASRYEQIQSSIADIAESLSSQGEMLSGEAQQLSQDWNQFRSSLSDNSLDSSIFLPLR